jgi:HSP20 family molecular chaperone IbpA
METTHGRGSNEIGREKRRDEAAGRDGVSAARKSAAGNRSPVRRLGIVLAQAVAAQSVRPRAVLARSWGKIPAVDIADTEKAYEITAELPGMDEKNVEVKFSNGVLTIKGEKKEEKEEKNKDYHLSERRYGSFQRSFTVPEGVDAEKIDATFKDGLLTVSLPKTPEAQKKEKQIAIKKG